MRFQVILAVGDPERGGNMATALEIYQVVERPSEMTGWVERLEPINPLAFLVLRVPVFHVGEVVIVDDDGREIPWPQRKASKWEVTYEMFDEVDLAVARARQVCERAEAGR